MQTLLNLMTTVGALFVVLFVAGGGVRMVVELFRGGRPTNEGFTMIICIGLLGCGMLLGSEVMRVSLGAPGVLGTVWNMIGSIASTIAGAF